MMEQLILDFPKHLREGQKIAEGINIQKRPKTPIRYIVVGGMGGSGIAGNLLRSFAGTYLDAPVLVNKSYHLPRFVGEDTLFIASSFSGNTEETLSALKDAQKAGALIFCITSGGKLLEIAQKEGYDYIQIPNEAPCPRAFLGYSLTQMLYALKAYALCEDFFSATLQSTILMIDEKQQQIREQAKQLAQDLVGKQIIAYSDGAMLPVLLRMQQQINENAKQLFHFNIFPEMNHNELVAWEREKTHYEQIMVLLLQAKVEHPRVQKRREITRDLLKVKAKNVIDITVSGETLISQSLHLIHLFDWVSFYLAEYNKVDVFAIESINHLKGELAKFDG